MGNYTENLNLYKTNMDTDGNDTFSFDRDLNENWDKIDAKVGELDAGSASTNLDNLTDEAIDYIRAVTDGTYVPVDLSVKHAEEIRTNHGGDVWAWIQSRIKSANYSGIHVRDYIPVQLSGGTIGGAVTIPENQQHYMQVAGIDTYYGMGDTPIPHHIDFIARCTIEETCTFNGGNTNNGTSAEPNPYKASRIYALCNGVNNYTTSAQGNLAHGLDCSSGGILQMLPTNCQNVLIQKRTWSEEQYSASAQVNYPTGNGWRDMGKVWIPHEVEVCGYQPNSYNRGETGTLDNLTRNLTVQYPLFKYQTRAKVGATTGARSNYWLCCPSGLASAVVCGVSAIGSVANYYATDENISVCFGFRIG